MGKVLAEQVLRQEFKSPESCKASYNGLTLYSLSLYDKMGDRDRSPWKLTGQLGKSELLQKNKETLSSELPMHTVALRCLQSQA